MRLVFCNSRLFFFFFSLTSETSPRASRPSRRLVRAKYPADAAVPVFVGGVSFGGLVAAHACARASAFGPRFAGCVLAAPCCDVEWTPLLRFQASIGAFLARVAPDVRGAAAVTPDRLSSDPAAIEEYVSDPLVHVAHVRFLAATEIVKGFDALREDAFYAPERFGDTPLLVMHGTADAACFFPASEAFVKRVKASDKTFVAMENGSHLLLHDAAMATRAREAICAFVCGRAEAFRRSAEKNAPHVARYGGVAGAVTEAAEVDIGARL